jgi:predicted negative regulator of RcsB-dependent stress response
MARDGIDRKSLKEDAFRDTMFWMVDWAYQRRSWLIGVGTLALVVVLGGSGYYLYQGAQSREQALRYFQVERDAQHPNLPEGERIVKARTAYEAFIADYPGAALAPTAWMHLARLAWQQGDPAAARKAFQTVLNHDQAGPALRDIARLGIATLKEQEGDLEASAMEVREISDEPYGVLKAFHLGRLAMERKQPGEARQQFEIASQGDPGSTLAEWARQNLDYLP